MITSVVFALCNTSHTQMIAATAMPVGGQIAVTCLATTANDSPNLAARM